MSTQNGGTFPDWGGRLKEERKRLLLSQDASCALLGIKDPKTLRSWESGSTSPGMADLVVLMRHGFDVVYVLTGKRAPGLGLAEARAEYVLPSQRAAAEIAGMNLDEDDADLLITLARRLTPPG
jgi:transcriptional regulator with XRE-family HTH domain